MGVGPRRTPAQRSSLAYVLSTSGESRSRVRIRVPLRAQIESASLSEPAALPPGIASVLAVLSSSAVVLDNEDRVLQASAAARAFGLVSGDQLVVQELVALARQVRRDGEIREGELDVSTTGVHRRGTSLAGRAAAPEAAAGWCCCWSRTRPRAAGWKRSGGTSSPTPATSSRPPWGRSRCWPRPLRTRPTTRR